MMPSLSRRWAVVATLSAVALLSACGGAPQTKTLTVTSQLAATKRGSVDANAPGRSKGDVYTSSALIQDETGKTVGHYDLSCRITDEDAGNGTARSLCTSSSDLDGRGEIDAVGMAVLTPNSTAKTPVGLLAQEAETAIVGGTGEFARAHGSVVSERNDQVRTVKYSYQR